MGKHGGYWAKRGYRMYHTARSLKQCILIMALFLLLAGGTHARAEGLLQPQGLNWAGVYGLRQMEPTLTGSGVRFVVVSRSQTYADDQPQNDYQPSASHKCFHEVPLTFQDDGRIPGRVSSHATAVCSILFGNDPDASDPSLGRFHYQGVAPQAQAEVLELWNFLTTRVFSQTQLDADVVTLSSGSDFEDWWTRGIEAMADRQGLLVVASIGNGTEAYHPPLFPGASANCLGVGVVDSVRSKSVVTKMTHFALVYPEHSSCGPTADIRCKPDMVAPGNCLAASADEPNRYDLTGNWSSFAAPVVAGVAGLLAQKAKDDPSLELAVSKQGGNCVLKAVLMNSAVKLPYWHKGQVGLEDDHSVPLDFIQGAGMVDAAGAYRQLASGRQIPGKVKAAGWDLSVLDKQRRIAQGYAFEVTGTEDQYITATVVWNRHYGDSYPFDRLQDQAGDLRLELWATDPSKSGADRLVDFSDSRTDNVEHIYCKAVPGYRRYEIVVLLNDKESGLAVQQERYAVAWSVGPRPQQDNVLWLDLNSDGVVNELDCAYLIQNWTATQDASQKYAIGDLNNDGVIDDKDLQDLVDHTNVRADWYTQ